MAANRTPPPSAGGAGDPSRSSATDTIEIVDDDGRATVIVRGDLDAVTAPELRATLLAVIERAPTTLRVDLAAVEFLDSAGISVLVVGHKRSSDNGVAFELAAVPEPSRRVLELTRLTDVFTIID